MKINNLNPLESNVNYYGTKFPERFKFASGSSIISSKGTEYIDFFMGAGALNYGHNHPLLQATLIDYISQGYLLHGLDMQTEIRDAFINNFNSIVLSPNKLSYKFAFPGPTGANAVELAMKIARFYTGRQNIISFTNAYHGMSLGALAATGNRRKRIFAGTTLPNITFFPYENYLDDSFDTISYIERLLSDQSSGFEKPAAIILETIQAEGGINVASRTWLTKLSSFCKAHDILVIIDDIQTGCGRTNHFFSFSDYNIQPDIICLSKSLSGIGLPLSLTLLKPELDIINSGDHNGTFRSNNLALATANAALQFWQDANFRNALIENSIHLETQLKCYIQKFSGIVKLRGRGMIFGLAYEPASYGETISDIAFSLGLIVETCGAYDQVIKLLPALNTTTSIIDHAIDILTTATEKALSREISNSKSRKKKQHKSVYSNS